MDKWGWLFGWVGVIAFILAVPLAIAANLLTPKVRDLWAATSRKRGIKRYEELGSQIEDLEEADVSELLASFCKSLLIAFVEAVFSLVALIMFAIANTNYITRINGMRLQEPSASSNKLLAVGLLTTAMFAIFYVAFVLTSVAGRETSRLLSTKYRTTELEALRLKQKDLGVELGIVDNSVPPT